jgi:ubiquitin-like modifier-activating enzyme ATG7
MKSWLDKPQSDFTWCVETVRKENNTYVSSNHALSKFMELCKDVTSIEGGTDRTLEICFVDTATGDAPSISLLNVLTFLDVRFQRTKPIDVACIRANNKGIFEFKTCLFLKQVQPLKNEVLENINTIGFKCIGWERDDKNRLKPRKADLSSAMDPEKLAREAVDLNLKLMRWRQAPTLHVDAISKSKIVLVGAGTLGCSVARTLLGWGVRNITFIDDGRVSFSNPARQSLFTFEDCLDGGKPKARAAAERLKDIVPDINANYIEMRVPMPGHAVAECERDEVLESIDALEKEIRNADAVFLLTDTRESRWLPTVLCAAHNIQCYNCALGFDTYLAMRHGVPTDALSNRKGCYFCNDVVAPIDSTRDRSLDQQCTVTRPGLAQIAGALAVELWVTASEESRRKDEKSNASSSIFGIHDDLADHEASEIPHQIRGSLRQFTQTIFQAPPFTNCVACSENVLREYRENGKSFLLSVFNSDKGDVLELASGIRDLLKGLREDDGEDDDDNDGDIFGACSEEEDF